MLIVHLGKWKQSAGLKWQLEHELQQHLSLIIVNAMKPPSSV